MTTPGTYDNTGSSYVTLTEIPDGWVKMTSKSPIIRPGQQVIYHSWNGITLHTAKHFIGFGPVWAMYYNPNDQNGRDDAKQ